MKSVRVWFSKAGSAKYISHLDLTRCMARALKLSGLPLWYTEGFNPHIYMTFSMPLSLGVTGERECMDIRLTEDFDLAEAVRRLKACLPEDIVVWEITEPEDGFDKVAFAEYELRLETEEPQALAEQIDRLLARESVVVLKHSKKGDKEFDIKPHFTILERECQPDGLTLRLRVTCSQEGSVNPSLLLDALKTYLNAEPYAEITRKKLLKKDFSDIR